MTGKKNTLYKSLEEFIDASWKDTNPLEFNEKLEEYKTDVFGEPLNMSELVQTGVPWSTFKKINDKLELTDQEWSFILEISTKSLQRYRASKATFRPIQSERILQLINITNLGLDAFDEFDKFRIWLRRPSFPLGGKTPLSLLNNIFGQQSVIRELGHIIHGISI